MSQSTATPSPLTLRQTQALLRGAGLQPDRRRGQHFLVDGNLMRKLVDSAELTLDDVVLEVGAGTASLTRMLAHLAGRVLAVEVDRRMFTIACEQVGGNPKVTLLHADVLQRKKKLADIVFDNLTANRPKDGRLLLVANLPYQVASPLLINLLLDVPSMTRFCFTVQLEVGDRLLAKPGTKAYGPISVLAQASSAGQRITRVPASAFWPRPKVESMMIRLDAHDRVDRRKVWQLIKVGFAHRRKTLKANLANWAGQADLDSACRRLGIDWQLRPEVLAVPQWIDLADHLPPHRPSASKPDRDASR